MICFNLIRVNEMMLFLCVYSTKPYLVYYSLWCQSAYLSYVHGYTPPIRFLLLVLSSLGCHWFYYVLRPCPATVTTTSASIVTNQSVYDEFMAILNVVILCLFSSSCLSVILLFCLVFHFGLVYDFWLGLVTLLACK